MASAIKAVEVTASGDYVIEIRSPIAFDIYKASGQEIRSVIANGEAPSQDITLIRLPMHLVEAFCETLLRLYGPGCAKLLDAHKQHINDIWVNDDF